ncbi:MAG TPA: VOC family protein [Candidatus Acidoferrum sp.]|nr:VOC family protein [Candidatus Acidoferrum sp.]
MEIERLDHLVLTVRDIAATCRFYQRVLGMRPVEFAPGRWAIHFGGSKLNLHAADHPVDPNVRHATPGSADVCFITKTAITDVIAELAAAQVPVILGPVSRIGARGSLLSVYFYDPDENLIEVANQVDERRTP